MVGVWRRILHPPEAIRGLPRQEVRRSGSDFCNFSMKTTRFCKYFGQNNYFKAITYQLKAFEKQSKHTK